MSMNFKRSKNEPIDRELQSLVDRYESLKSNPEGRSAACAELTRDIMGFRYKLAYNRGTESYENRYDWAPMLKAMLATLEDCSSAGAS